MAHKIVFVPTASETTIRESTSFALDDDKESTTSRVFEPEPEPDDEKTKEEIENERLWRDLRAQNILGNILESLKSQSAGLIERIYNGTAASREDFVMFWEVLKQLGLLDDLFNNFMNGVLEVANKIKNKTGSATDGIQAAILLNQFGILHKGAKQDGIGFSRFTINTSVNSAISKFHTNYSKSHYTPPVSKFSSKQQLRTPESASDQCKPRLRTTKVKSQSAKQVGIKTPKKPHNKLFLCKFCHVEFQRYEILVKHLKDEHEKGNIQIARKVREMEKPLIEKSGSGGMGDFANEHLGVTTDLAFKGLEDSSPTKNKANDQADRLTDVERYESKEVGNGSSASESTCSTKNTFECDICYKTQFPAGMDLATHLIQDHKLYKSAADKINNILGKNVSAASKATQQSDNNQEETRPFDTSTRCGECEICFDSPQDCNDHMEAVHDMPHHDMEQTTSKQAKKVKLALGCDLCPKSFPSVDCLMIHLMSDHCLSTKQAKSKVKGFYVIQVFGCRLCPAKFKVWDHLKEHRLKKHSVSLPSTKQDDEFPPEQDTVSEGANQNKKEEQDTCTPAHNVSQEPVEHGIGEQQGKLKQKYVCDMCPFVSGMRDILRIHMIQEHGISDQEAKTRLHELYQTAKEIVSDGEEFDREVDKKYPSRKTKRKQITEKDLGGQSDEEISTVEDEESSDGSVYDPTKSSVKKTKKKAKHKKGKINFSSTPHTCNFCLSNFADRESLDHHWKSHTSTCILGLPTSFVTNEITKLIGE